MSELKEILLLALLCCPILWFCIAGAVGRAFITIRKYVSICISYFFYPDLYKEYRLRKEGRIR